MARLNFGFRPLQIPTALLKTFNSSLTELGAELALIALKEDGFGPFQPQSSRGFSAREIQAIVRALSYPEVTFPPVSGNGQPRPSKIRMRRPSPCHPSRRVLTWRFT